MRDEPMFTVPVDFTWREFCEAHDEWWARESQRCCFPRTREAQERFDRVVGALRDADAVVKEFVTDESEAA